MQFDSNLILNNNLSMVMGFGISIAGLVLGYMLRVCVKGNYSDYHKPLPNTFENKTKYEEYYI